MANPLNLRNDSYSSRVRGTSHIDFKTATTGVAAKAMRNEISHLVSTVEDHQLKKVPFHLFSSPFNAPNPYPLPGI